MNDKKHPFDESLISAYLDGELNESEQREFEAFIQNTPSLKQLVKDISTVRSMVAAASPLEKSTRSFQSAEWTASATIPNASPSEPLTAAPSTNSATTSNRNHLSLGLLASLAAVVLIFITTKWLMDKQPYSGQQIALDTNPPQSLPPAELHAESAPQKSMAASAEEPEAQLDPARGRRAAIDAPAPSIAPMVAEEMSAPQVAGAAAPPFSSEARDFLAYVEQKLNAEANIQETSRWRFISGNVGNANFQAETPDLPQGVSVDESARIIYVEPGQSEDEIILQMTAENAKAILQLANLDREPSEDLSKEPDLLAIAVPSRQGIAKPTDTKMEQDRSDRIADSRNQKTWTIDFSPQLADNIALATDKSGAMGKELVDGSSLGGGPGSGMSGLGGGYGGGYGGIPNEASERSQSKVSGSGFFSPKPSAMRAANKPDSQSANPSTAPQSSTDPTTQTQQSLKSANLATELGKERGASPESQAKEKRMRIRILIKKEPSSSGSNE